jgi:hypothetical protein
MSAILLVDPTVGTVYAFETMTLGGRGCLDKLRRDYAKVYHQRSREYPLIEIGTESYETKRGTNYNPTFAIIGWVQQTAEILAAVPRAEAEKPALPNLSEPPADEHGDPGPVDTGPGPDDLPDDEIPF